MIDRADADSRRWGPCRQATHRQPGNLSALRPAWRRSTCSVYPFNSTRGAIARLRTGQARVAEPGQKPNSSRQIATFLPFVARFGPDHRRTQRRSTYLLRTHRPMHRTVPKHPALPWNPGGQAAGNRAGVLVGQAKRATRVDTTVPRSAFPGHCTAIGHAGSEQNPTGIHIRSYSSLVTQRSRGAANGDPFSRWFRSSEARGALACV
jgi:hypothetical protein